LRLLTYKLNNYLPIIFFDLEIADYYYTD